MVAIVWENGKVREDHLAGLRVHPMAELLPLLEGEEFGQLVEDIRINGLREPIAFTPDGQLLDGRNRYRACMEIGVDPQSKIVDAEPVAYVLSANIHRRHLTDRQRVVIGARIANREWGSNQHKTKEPPTGNSSRSTPSREQTADLLKVGRRSIDRCKEVLATGTESLVEAVADDVVSINKAARVAQLPPEEQDVWVAQVRDGAPPRKHPLPGEDVSQKPHKRLDASPSRHKWVLASSIRETISILSGLGLVLDGATHGLDPNVTSEQAEVLRKGLSKSLGVGRRALALLKERTHTEETQEDDTSVTGNPPYPGGPADC
jgi:hypothetical protein